MVKRLFRLILNYINGDKLVVWRSVSVDFKIWYTIDIIRNGKYIGTQSCGEYGLDHILGEIKEYWKIERVKYEN